ncbi:MAG: PPC domain-containing protein, partial [Deltaproteobacteria bacterium]|nr:PPC domain-containing protein [Deltaproteobacteria bacterium]
ADTDFFKFFIKKGDSVLFYADSGQGLSPDVQTVFDLDIRDAGGAQLKSGDGDFIEFTAPESGYYYLSVGAPASGSGVSYYVHSYSLKEPCVPSVFDLQFGKEVSFRLCEGETKIFDLFLDKGDSFGAEISFESGGGDIDIGLFRDGEVLPSAISDKKGDGEDLRFDSPAAAGYKFVLKGWGGAGNMVKMTTELKSVSEECSDDLFAPNGDEETAVMLPEGEYAGLKLCPGNGDWFAIGLNGGEELSLLAETGAQSVKIFTRIFNPDGTGCGENISEGSSALSICGAKVPGDYILQVDSDGIYKIGYDMLIEVGEPQFCNPDRFEINDSPKSAPAISEGFTTHLTSCGANADYFSLNLPALSLLSAYLFTDGEIEFSLLSGDDFSVLKQGIKSSGGEAIFPLVPKGGEYILKVEGQGEGVYDIGYIVESP